MSTTPVTSSSHGFWGGVASGVVTSTIIAFLSLAWVPVSQWFQEPLLKVEVTQTPVEVGRLFDATILEREYLIAGIRSSNYVGEGQRSFLDTKKAEVFGANRENIVKIVELMTAPPRAIQVIKINNPNKRVVNSIQLKVDYVVGLTVPSPDGAYNLQKEGNITLSKIDPFETITIFAWLGRVIDMSYTRNIRVLASDEAIPVSFLSEGGDANFDDVYSKYGPIVFLVPIIFLGGLILIIAIPFEILSRYNDAYRRKLINKDQFETMLADVRALYPKFRQISAEKQDSFLQHTDGDN